MLSPRIKRILSLLLAFHVIAVFLGPYSMPRPAIAMDLQKVWGWYVQGMFLDHGYQFFAPEPGPSHLVRYEIEKEDGSKLEGVFPNHQEHWPRLSYHRHFMLSEFLNTMSDVPSDAPAVSQELAVAQDIKNAYISSVAYHLLDEHAGTRVTLFQRRHHLPSPEQVKSGVKLDDPRSYEEKKIGIFRRQIVNNDTKIITRETPVEESTERPKGQGGAPPRAGKSVIDAEIIPPKRGPKAPPK